MIRCCTLNSKPNSLGACVRACALLVLSYSLTSANNLVAIDIYQQSTINNSNNNNIDIPPAMPPYRNNISSMPSPATRRRHHDHRHTLVNPTTETVRRSTTITSHLSHRHPLIAPLPCPGPPASLSTYNSVCRRLVLIEWPAPASPCLAQRPTQL